MFDPPRTLTDARAYRYGEWAGEPDGYRYVEGRCAYEAWDSSGWHSFQCARKNGHGPDRLYCKQHAAKVAKRGTP
jgi:hypothetical protein